MKSTNFEFLRPNYPALADLCGFAEQYCETDPESAAVKLRTLTEEMVKTIYNKHGLMYPVAQASIHDLLNGTRFRNAVPDAVLQVFHLLRKSGNDGAHGHTVAKSRIRFLLKQTYGLAGWFHVRYGGGKRSDLPDYEEPQSVSLEDQEKENKRLRQQNKEWEAALVKAQEELEQARKDNKVAEATDSELAQAKLAGQEDANSLGFNEAETRAMIIDMNLRDAGWNVNDESQVSVEYLLDSQPTLSGNGKADYVLWDDDHKPLAVIEAKRAASDARNGQKQAELYADSLEKKFGQRPLIYFTNGYDIHFWNDHWKNESDRKIYGFHQKDSLQYMVLQRSIRKPVDDIDINHEIIPGRLYQEEAVRRVVESFSRGHRRALIVQATGTGKTRVAIALCDALINAGWARRILFLCDRRELRKQAKEKFVEFMEEPLVYVTARTHQERQHRIYLATYPAMSKYFTTFDVGFFDLIIADESHRSIYNRYREIFEYFDSRAVGLTATPVRFVERNTYQLFGCEDQDPTAKYEYEDAVAAGHLVPFEVKSIMLGLMRKGIKYKELTEAQRLELDEQDENAQQISFEQRDVDKKVFNKDSNRHILRNLMENGLRLKTEEGDDDELGKTIIFARNHKHAEHLCDLFKEMYKQYGGDYCQVIDTHNSRAEQLITEFKDPNHRLTIAISVDMLDTGIDVPEVLNLVFAKPVYSYVKFWQMIGRGTRTCRNLFGDGLHKKKFLIFDHWENFKYFDEDYVEQEPQVSRPILHKLFLARLELAEEGLKKQNVYAMDMALKRLVDDAMDLPEKSVSVKEKLKDVHWARSIDNIKPLNQSVVDVLKNKIAPLMKWRVTAGMQQAYQLDLLMARLQLQVLKKSQAVDQLVFELQQRTGELQININQVRAKIALIEQIKKEDYWQSVKEDGDIQALEKLRQELRLIMKYRAKRPVVTPPPKVIDIKENEADIVIEDYQPKIQGMQEVLFRKRVDEVLQGLIDKSPTLQKIKRGEPVGHGEIAELVSLVLTQDPNLDLNLLKDYYPRTADHLDLAIRGIIGLNADEVEKRFSDFVARHKLNSTQNKFLQLLQRHIAKFGSIEIDDLYEAPFTTLASEGVDGIFANDKEIDELLNIVDTFKPPPEPPETPEPPEVRETSETSEPQEERGS